MAERRKKNKLKRLSRWASSSKTRKESPSNSQALITAATSTPPNSSSTNEPTASAPPPRSTSLYSAGAGSISPRGSSGSVGSSANASSKSVLQALDRKPLASSEAAPKLNHQTASRPMMAKRRPPSRKPRTVDPKVSAALSAAKTTPPSANPSASAASSGSSWGAKAAAGPTARRRGTLTGTSAVKSVGAKKIMRIFLEDDTMKTIAITLPCNMDAIIAQMNKKMRGADTSGWALYHYNEEAPLREYSPDESVASCLAQWEGQSSPKMVYKKRTEVPKPTSTTVASGESAISGLGGNSFSMRIAEILSLFPDPPSHIPIKDAPPEASSGPSGSSSPSSASSIDRAPQQSKPTTSSSAGPSLLAMAASSQTQRSPMPGNTASGPPSSSASGPPSSSPGVGSGGGTGDERSSASPSSQPPGSPAPTRPTGGVALMGTSSMDGTKAPGSPGSQRLDVSVVAKTTTASIPQRSDGRLPTLRLPKGGRGSAGGGVVPRGMPGARRTGLPQLRMSGGAPRGALGGAPRGAAVRGGPQRPFTTSYSGPMAHTSTSPGGGGGAIGPGGNVGRGTARGEGNTRGGGVRGVGARGGQNQARPIARGGVAARKMNARGGVSSGGAVAARGGVSSGGAVAARGGVSSGGAVAARGGVSSGGAVAARGGVSSGTRGQGKTMRGGTPPTVGAYSSGRGGHTEASPAPARTTSPALTKDATSSAGNAPSATSLQANTSRVPVEQWTPGDVAAWLHSFEQGAHCDKFKKFGGKAVLRLNIDTLERLIGDLSDAILIEQEIEELKTNPPPYPPTHVDGPSSSSDGLGPPPSELGPPPSELGPPPSELGPPPSELGPPPSELGPPPSSFGQPPPAQKKVPPPVNHAAKGDSKRVLGVPPKAVLGVPPKGVRGREAVPRGRGNVRGGPRGGRPPRGYAGGRPPRPSRGMRSLNASQPGRPHRGAASRGFAGSASIGPRGGMRGGARGNPPLIKSATSPARGLARTAPARPARPSSPRGGARSARGGAGGRGGGRGAAIGGSAPPSSNAISTPVFAPSGGKDAIARVHLEKSSGPYRSFLVVVDQTCEGLSSNVNKKFKADKPDLVGYTLFHVRGSRERKLEDGEVVLPLISGFSAGDKLVYKHHSNTIVMKKEIIKVYLEDGTYKTLALEPTDTATKLVGQLARKTGQGPAGFNLWEVHADGDSTRIDGAELPAERKLEWPEGSRFVYTKEKTQAAVSSIKVGAAPPGGGAAASASSSPMMRGGRAGRGARGGGAAPFNPGRAALGISMGGMMQGALAGAAAEAAAGLHTKAKARKVQKEMQKMSFTRWFDYQLAKRDYFIQDLSTDACDGVLIINLLEILTGENLGAYHDKPEMTVFEKLENLNIVFRHLRTIGITVGSCGPEDIADGNINLILSVVWQLIFNSVVSPFNPRTLVEAAAKKSVLTWSQSALSGHEVAVENLSSSWSDGRGFAALVCVLKPELLAWPTIKDASPSERMVKVNALLDETYAVQPVLAPRFFGVPGVPLDEKSVVAFLMVLKELLV